MKLSFVILGCPDWTIERIVQKTLNEGGLVVCLKF